MKKVIMLTEQDVFRIVKESAVKLANEILKEDGGVIGDASAATNGSGFINGAPNAEISSNAQYDVPAFGGKVQRKKGYLKNKVNIEPALKRHDGKGGSISIPKD